MNPIKIYKSAVDGKYYQAAGNPEAQRKFEAAGILAPSDISSVQAITVLNEVLGLSTTKLQFTQRMPRHTHG